MILRLQFYAVYFQSVNPLHTFESPAIPTHPSGTEKFKLSPSLGRKCFEGSWCIFNRFHSCKVNVSTFIRHVFILL